MSKHTVKGRYGYANNRDFKELFGIDPNAHWPKGGIPARIMDGIKVWVKPAKVPVERTRWDYRSGKTVGSYVKTSNHRVMAECPECKQVLSAGRLHQHKCDKA